jgi:hypothetical protein
MLLSSASKAGILWGSIATNRRLQVQSAACHICFNHGVRVLASYRADRRVLVRLARSTSTELSARILGLRR